MPAEVDRPGLVRRTLDHRAARIAAPVVVVDPMGALALVPPLGVRPPEDQPARIQLGRTVDDSSPGHFLR